MDMQASDIELEVESAAPARWRLRRRAAFALLVLLPTVLTLLYTLLLASPQYVSNAEYMIRGVEQKSAEGGLLAGLMAPGAAGPGQGESQAVRDFMVSSDAIAGLKARGVDVAALYTRSDADWFSRLTPARPRAEKLLDFYRAHVKVEYDQTSNLTKLSVRAFAPDDARILTAALIALGEERVNSFNQRAVAAARRDAQASLAAAEADVTAIQGRLTAFRDLTRDIDPATSGEGAQTQLEKAEAQLIAQRAELAGMRASLAASSPLVISAQARVSTLERTVADLRARLTGGANAVNRRLAEYEELKFKQELAAKRYDDARARLVRADEQAARERLFLVPVVMPNQPERPAWPKPFGTTLAVFLALATAYAILWLLLAGVREHMAD
jgi:capsular polysaccharide transport system permease protein